MKSKLANNISILINNILKKTGIKEETRLAFIKYFFNTGWMFAEKALFLIGAFFVGIYVARYLGPDKYGIFNYALSFVFLFQAFSKLGLDGIVTRNLIQTPQKKLEILGTSLTLKITGAIFSLVLIIISIQFTSSDYQTKVMIVIVAIGMLFNSFEVARFFFEAEVKAKYSSLASSISILLSSGLKVLLVILQADLFWFAIAYSVEIFVRGTGFLIIYQQKYKNIFQWTYDKNLSLSLLKDSWPLILSSMAVMLYMRIDQIMLKEMLGNKEVGLYSAAVKISEVWYFIPVIISSSIFPAILDAKKKSEELYDKRMQQLYRLISLIALVITLPILIWGKDIIPALYGNSFKEAGNVLQIQIISLIFVFWGHSSGKWLIAENYVKISMYRTLTGAFINIIANIILIKEYGIIGAAFATLLSYMVAGFLFDAFNKKTHIAFKMKYKSLLFFNYRK